MARNFKELEAKMSPESRARVQARVQTTLNEMKTMDEVREEAVVGKTSRVVEEVVVGKEASQRTDTIRDSVSKTEVEVENLAGSTTGSTTRRAR